VIVKNIETENSIADGISEQPAITVREQANSRLRAIKNGFIFKLPIIL
jgi:cellobiose-specific phosphotransferase system component IIC